jgi:hypothetical protein
VNKQSLSYNGEFILGTCSGNVSRDEGLGRLGGLGLLEMDGGKTIGERKVVIKVGEHFKICTL